MNLFLIRHADALSEKAAGVTCDEDRPLSDLGKAQSLRIGHMLRAFGITFSSIVTSPLLRARQTGEGINAAFGLPTEQHVVFDHLAPGGRSKKVARFLNGFSDESIAMIGHQPDMSRYCAWLIGSKLAQIDFAKAAVALIETKGGISKGCGILQWLVTPEWMTMMETTPKE